MTSNLEYSVDDFELEMIRSVRNQVGLISTLLAACDNDTAFDNQEMLSFLWAIWQPLKDFVKIAEERRSAEDAIASSPSLHA